MTAKLHRGDTKDLSDPDYDVEQADTSRSMPAPSSSGNDDGDDGEEQPPWNKNA
jgi:hypothetical protein